MERREKTTTDWLWELGVTHERDQFSFNDGKHSLFFAGRMIGRYSAFEVLNLLSDNGLIAEANS